MRLLRRPIVLITTIILSGLALSLVPLPVRRVHEDTAIRKSLAAIQSGKPVLLDWKYVPFYHFHDGVDPAKLTLYFQDETNISEDVFTDCGLKPLPDGVNPYAGMELPAAENFFANNAIVYVTYGDCSSDDDNPDDLHLWFEYGTLAGQCYRLTIMRNFWGVFVFYKCVGVS